MQIADIADFLQKQGFFPERRVLSFDEDAREVFVGYRRIAGLESNVCVGIVVSPNRAAWPEVYLLDWHKDRGLRDVLQNRHVNVYGRVCYIDEESSWWSAADTERQAAQMLLYLDELLEMVSANNVPLADVLQHFPAYWNAEAQVYASEGLEPGKLYQIVAVENRAGTAGWLIPQDSSDKSSLAQWALEQPYRLSTGMVCLDLQGSPGDLPVVDLPSTVSQVISWLMQSSVSNDSLDRHIYKVVEKAFSERFGTKHRRIDARDNRPLCVGLACNWRLSDHIYGAFGVLLEIPLASAKTIMSRRGKQAHGLLLKCHAKASRYDIKDGSTAFIHSRNTPGLETLEDKRVVLIGVGAIGGFLAQILAHAGAGLGKKGKLTLIDPDDFDVPNISRHLLGAGALGKPKVEAMKKSLQSALPYLKIEAIPFNVGSQLEKVWNSDIVINATGSESVAIELETDARQHNAVVPILHGWIAGHGSAIEGLLNPRQGKHACFRCLYHEVAGTLSRRHSILRDVESSAPVIHGCGASFYQYGTSTPMAAASLMGQMTRDWASGKSKHTLRHHVLDMEACENRQGSTPLSSKDCPLCAKNG